MSGKREREGPEAAANPEKKAAVAPTDTSAPSHAIIIVGASGDLSKKKTYPAFFKLFVNNQLPLPCRIWGLDRVACEEQAFRQNVRGWLEKAAEGRTDCVDAFLQMLVYMNGSASEHKDVTELDSQITAWEGRASRTEHNRMFYLAIPPFVFGPAAQGIKQHAMAKDGWTRVIVEKPFGHDLSSCEALLREMDRLLKEDQLYRIDHYLGKEMVQNLSAVRFGNAIFEPLWNRHHIASVSVTFKEAATVVGRAGYFDGVGLIRDVMQNHLLQLVTLVAMEPPVSLSSEDVRDEKVKVLRAMTPLNLSDMVLGQYEGYTFEAEVPDSSSTETFAQAVMTINNSRWSGVPFVVKCAKASNETKCEIRIQFVKSPLPYHREGQGANRNELVIRVQPDEAMYLKTNMKQVGEAGIVTAELDLSYHKRFPDAYVPEAYEKLIKDCFTGNQANFVRDDELRESWRLFDGLLAEISAKKPTPLIYKRGSRGPEAADEKLTALGVQRTHEYSGPGWSRTNQTQ
jgi:glucose-6-phosphate 1-dehydrogenase